MSLSAEFQRAELRLAEMVNRRADAEEAQARADSAAEAQERRDRIRRDAERCSAHQERYDNVFTKFGKRAPMALADDEPPTYRRQLFGLGQTMLPSDHWLAKVDPMEIDGKVIAPLEQMLIEALEAENENPSVENLPETVADSRARIEKIDPETNERRIEWRARESFIKELSRPGRKVASFQTNRGNVFCNPRSA
jgi:hypothetical protein